MTGLTGIRNEIKAALDLSTVLAGVPIVIATGINSDEIKTHANNAACIVIERTTGGTRQATNSNELVCNCQFEVSIMCNPDVVDLADEYMVEVMQLIKAIAPDENGDEFDISGYDVMSWPGCDARSVLFSKNVPMKTPTT
jgi:hypothetical protein